MSSLYHAKEPLRLGTNLMDDLSIDRLW
jgi:hypothetical protein